MKYIHHFILVFFFLQITHLATISASNPDSSDLVKPISLFETNYGISKLMTGYAELYENPSQFLEIRAAKQTMGKRIWQHDFAFPEVGITFVYGDLGNKNIFGQTYGLIPDVTLNTLSNKAFSIKVKLGVGLAYFTKPYDKITNTENTYIGSHIANMSTAAFMLRLKVNEKLYLQYGINYFHCSNGHYQVPNVGMNIPGMKIGINYYPKGKQQPTRKKSGSRKSGWRKNINIGLGVHEFAGTLGPVGGPKYRVNTAEIGGYKKYNSIINLKVGVSCKYYTDYLMFSEKHNIFKKNPKLKSSVFSVFVGNEFLLYKVGVYLQTGMDLYAPFEKEYNKLAHRTNNFSNYMEEFVSSKIGINYYFNDPEIMNQTNPYIGIFIKTDFAMADFIGFHVGIML